MMMMIIITAMMRATLRMKTTMITHGLDDNDDDL